MRISTALFTATFATAFALVLGVSVSSAGTLTTPALFAGSAQNVCVVINVGTTPADVTIQMIGLTSTDTETCAGETAVQPNDINSSCQAAVNDFAFCRVTSTKSKSLRVVMFNRQTTAPFTINAAVDGR